MRQAKKAEAEAQKNAGIDAAGPGAYLPENQKGGMKMLQPKDMIKQMIEFNKSAYENASKNMNVLQEQMEKMLNQYID